MAGQNLPLANQPNITTPTNDMIFAVQSDEQTPGTFTWFKLAFGDLSTNFLNSAFSAKGQILVGTGLNSYTQ